MERSFRIAIKSTWLVAGFCILCFLMMYVLPKFGIDWRENFFFLFFFIPLFFFCVILLPLLYYYRKRYLSGAKELLGGNYLAHWHYHRDEWARFAEGEWKRAQRMALWTPFAVVAGIVVLGYLFKGWTVDDYKLVLPWIFGLAVLGALLMYLFGLSNYRRMKGKTGEVFIGYSGLYFNDTYYAWDVFGARLGKVEFIDGDPAILQFEILYASRTGTRPSDVRIPIPSAHKKEAAKLVLKYPARG